MTQQPHPGAGRSDVGPGIDDAWRALPKLGEQAVGVFGAALDVDMPLVLYIGWGGLLAGIVGVALHLGNPRERLLLIGTATVVLCSVFALSIAVRPTGFPVQARHLLPLAVLLPIGAGEVLRRHADRVAAGTARRALLGTVAIAAGVHVAAWYVNAHAWAGAAAGPGFLLSDADWSPPISWPLLSLLFLIGAAAILLATWRTQRAAP